MKKTLTLLAFALAATVLALLLQHRSGSEVALPPSKVDSADAETVLDGALPSASSRRAAAPGVPGWTGELSAATSISFRAYGSEVQLEGSGRLVLADGRGGRHEFPIDDGSAVLRAELDPSEPLFVLTVELDGDSYSYVDLDATWEELVEASPVEVFPGEPVPARVHEPSGSESVARLTLAAPNNFGWVFGAPEYFGFSIQVTSPIALPFVRSGASLEVSAPARWARFTVPDPVEFVDGTLRFEHIELQDTFDIEIVLHAETRLSGLQFVVSPVAERRQRGEVTRGSPIAWVMESAWEDTPEGPALRFAREGLPAGRYSVGFTELGEQEGLFVTPGELELGPGLPQSFDLWVSAPEPRPVLCSRILLRFARPVDELVALAEGPLEVAFTAMDGGQLAGGQERDTSFTLTRNGPKRIDEWTVALAPGGGFVSGEYDFTIRPIAIGQRFQVEPGQAEHVIEVPPLGLVELRWSDTEDVGATLPARTLPRVAMPDYAPPVARPFPVEPIHATPETAIYLLAYGEYALVGLAGDYYYEPEVFRVSEPQVVVRVEEISGYSRVLQWQVGGKPQGLPFTSLRSASLLRGGEPVADAIVSADGLDLASGRMAGLRITTRSPGAYGLEYSYVGADGSDVVGLVEQFDIGIEELPPVPQELEP